SGRERGAPTGGRRDDEAIDADAARVEHMRLLAMRKRQIQRKAARGADPTTKIPSGGGAVLGNDVRTRMESQLGSDLSQVRVHNSGESATAAEQLGARAFTVGSDVHFGAGEFSPGTKEGDKLLAHELTHVVQGQKSGGVQRKAAAEDSGAEDREDEEHLSHPEDPAEKEADSVAEHVG